MESPAILACSYEKQRLLCILSSTYSSFRWKLENSYTVFINKTRGQDFFMRLLHCSSLFGDKKIYIFAKISNEGGIAYVNRG